LNLQNRFLVLSFLAVSANFHFYTTLFIMFINSVAKLDISSMSQASQETLSELFMAVFKIFERNGSLYRYISNLTAKYKELVATDFDKLYRGKGAILFEKNSQTFIVDASLQVIVLSYYTPFRSILPF